MDSSLDWMRSYLAPWEANECAIYKYQHVGSKRPEEWMILRLESISLKDIMGHVAFLRLTKHLGWADCRLRARKTQAVGPGYPSYQSEA